MYNLVLLGPAGSGKSTQARALATRFGLGHIDMGGALREAAKVGSLLGQEIDQLINVRKVLVPDAVVTHVLEESLHQVPADRGVVLDGAPRRLAQVAGIEEVLARFGRTIDKVVYVSIRLEAAIERIKTRYHCVKCQKPLVLGQDIASVSDVCPVCGSPIEQRKDDTPEGVRRRFEVFAQETIPVIEHFRSLGKLIEVDGEKGSAEIEATIVEFLKQ